MDDKERKVLLETRLRNIKRKFAKLSQHADLTDECLSLKSEIDSIEHEIKLMN